MDVNSMRAANQLWLPASMLPASACTRVSCQVTRRLHPTKFKNFQQALIRLHPACCFATMLARQARAVAPLPSLRSHRQAHRHHNRQCVLPLRHAYVVRLLRMSSCVSQSQVPVQRQSQPRGAPGCKHRVPGDRYPPALPADSLPGHSHQQIPTMMHKSQSPTSIHHGLRTARHKRPFSRC